MTKRNYATTCFHCKGSGYKITKPVLNPKVDCTTCEGKGYITFPNRIYK